MPQGESAYGHIAKGLGAGLGGGIQQGIGQYLQQKEQRRQAEGFRPIFQQLNVPKAGVDQLLSAGLSAENLIKIASNIQENNALQAYNRQFGSSQERQPTEESSIQKGGPLQQESLTDSQLQQRPPQQQPQAIVPSKEKISPVLATKQIPNPVSASQIPAHAGARQQALSRADTITKTGRERRASRADEAQFLDPIVKRAIQLADKGSVSGVAGYLQAASGERFPFTKGPDVKEFQRIMKELTVGRLTDFVRPTGSEFFYLTDVYSRAGDPKESMKRNLNFQLEVNKINRKAKQIENEILQKYGEYPINIDDMIAEKMDPYYKNMLKNLGYNSWENKNSKKANELNSGEIELKVYDNKGKHIGYVNSNQTSELPPGYTTQ